MPILIELKSKTYFHVFNRRETLGEIVIMETSANMTVAIVSREKVSRLTASFPPPWADLLPQPQLPICKRR